eukprot:jgi/Chlat1/1411/Chrsp12S01978
MSFFLSSVCRTQERLARAEHAAESSERLLREMESRLKRETAKVQAAQRRCEALELQLRQQQLSFLRSSQEMGSQHKRTMEEQRKEIEYLHGVVEQRDDDLQHYHSLVASLQSDLARYRNMSTKLDALKVDIARQSATMQKGNAHDDENSNPNIMSDTPRNTWNKVHDDRVLSVGVQCDALDMSTQNAACAPRSTPPANTKITGHPSIGKHHGGKAKVNNL